jgi:hypothetical protein
MFTVQLDRMHRIIRFRASGTLSPDDMKHLLDEARWAYDQFRGAEHLILADMRGMAVMAPEVAAQFGEAIRYGRANGTVCCVHLSDSSIARLQTSRIARENSPYDDITINVVSTEEGEKVLEEKSKTLRPAPR